VSQVVPCRQTDRHDKLIVAFVILWTYRKQKLHLDWLFVCCRSWLEALLVDFTSKVKYCNFVSSWKAVITAGSTLYASNNLYKFTKAGKRKWWYIVIEMFYLGKGGVVCMKKVCQHCFMPCAVLSVILNHRTVCVCV